MGQAAAKRNKVDKKSVLRDEFMISPLDSRRILHQKREGKNAR
jgi:hypothetical protein